MVRAANVLSYVARQCWLEIAPEAPPLAEVAHLVVCVLSVAKNSQAPDPAWTGCGTLVGGAFNMNSVLSHLEARGSETEP